MGTFERVAAFYAAYPSEKRVYGRSETGLPLFAMRTGGGDKTVIVQCAIHAREYVTAGVGLRLLNVGDWGATIWVLPLTNPDGVRISEEGTDWLDERRRARIRAFAGKTSLPLYKANADGVDLNVNFNARWGTGAKNVFSPASENYVGPYWESAAESRALVAFTREINPDLTVSLHTKGEVTYWQFGQVGARRTAHYRVARAFAAASGYPLSDEGKSAGGYKDWCIEKLGIPALTAELGADEYRHPLAWELAQELFLPVGRGLRAAIGAISEET